MSEVVDQPSGGLGPLGNFLVLAAAVYLAYFLNQFFHRQLFIRGHPQGPLTQCKSNLKNIGTAFEIYSTDWSGKYPRSLALLTPNYLKSLPECRVAGRVSYKASMGQAAPHNSEGYPDYYFVECVGDYHKDSGVPVNYPQYNGIVGLIER